MMVGRIGPGWLPWVFGNCRVNGSLPKKRDGGVWVFEIYSKTLMSKL